MYIRDLHIIIWTVDIDGVPVSHYLFRKSAEKMYKKLSKNGKDKSYGYGGVPLFLFATKGD